MSNWGNIIIRGDSESGMSTTVYDPANKAEQVLTISDLSDLVQVIVSTQPTLQDYITNEWSSGDLNIGDKVIITGGAENENYVLATNTGSVIGDYIHLTATDSSEVKNDSSIVTGTTITNAIDNLNNTYHGVVELPALTDNGNGTINIASGGVFNFTLQANGNSSIVRLTDTTGINNLTLTDSSTNYVYINYNSGSPIFEATLNPSIFISDGRLVPVYRVVREGNELHYLDYDSYAIGLADKHFYKDVSLRGFERQNGLILSTEATRVSTISQGSSWFGIQLFNLDENKAGTTGELYEYYLTAGVWGSALVTEYDSTYYSDGTNRLTMSSNRYVSKYFFRGVESENHAYYVHGNQYNSAAAALAEPVPVVPSVITSHSIYVGKIVIQQGLTNGTAYPRTWGETIQTGGAVNHNDLSDIQLAGTGVTYGHISSVEQVIFGQKEFNDNILLGTSTIEAWDTDLAVLRIGKNGSIVSKKTTSDFLLLDNVYFDGSTYRFIEDGSSCGIGLYKGGDITFYNSESGLAGEVATSVPTARIKGRLFGIGTLNPEGIVHIYSDSADNALRIERFDSVTQGLKTIDYKKIKTDLGFDTGSTIGLGAMTEYLLEDSSGEHLLGYFGVSALNEVNSGHLRFIPMHEGVSQLDKEFRIDSQGNVISKGGNISLGIDVMEAWDSDYSVIRNGRSGSVVSSKVANDVSMLNNLYFDGTNYKFIENGNAIKLSLNEDGSTSLQTSLGIAGNTAPLNSIFNIDIDGNVLTNKTLTVNTIAGLDLFTLTPREGMLVNAGTVIGDFTETGMWFYEDSAWKKMGDVSTHSQNTFTNTNNFITNETVVQEWQSTDVPSPSITIESDNYGGDLSLIGHYSGSDKLIIGIDTYSNVLFADGNLIFNDANDIFQFQKDIVQKPSASITPTNNGELVVEATDNSTLTFKLKGTDGTVRTGTITLS
jgi:hypothetical protein